MKSILLVLSIFMAYESFAALFNPAKILGVTNVAKTLTKDAETAETLAAVAKLIKAEEQLGGDVKIVTSTASKLAEYLKTGIKKSIGLITRAKDEGLNFIKLATSRGKDFAKRALNEVIGGAKKVATGADDVPTGFEKVLIEKSGEPSSFVLVRSFEKTDEIPQTAEALEAMAKASKVVDAAETATFDANEGFQLAKEIGDIASGPKVFAAVTRTIKEGNLAKEEAVGLVKNGSKLLGADFFTLADKFGYEKMAKFIKGFPDNAAEVLKNEGGVAKILEASDTPVFMDTPALYKWINTPGA